MQKPTSNWAFDDDGLIKDPEEALAWTAAYINQNLAAYPQWFIPYSGGKDSTTVIQSIVVLLDRGEIVRPDRIVIGMADTKMEFWSFLYHANRSIKMAVKAFQERGINSEYFITSPRVEDDFWVRILGHGYIPPTPNMRWCTDKMKIVPMRKHLKLMGLTNSPALLGVRFGESDRRDKHLSCTIGGECGPDSMARNLKNTKEPIVRWRQCAIWDFLTLIAPNHGFNNDSLVMHYGPDGDLRYGCWSCPLIFNDKTAEYQKRNTPALYELIAWTNANLRRGGEAFKTQNRELYRKEDKGSEKDGRLAIRYTRRLLSELLAIQNKHGLKLLEPYQVQAIKVQWSYRESLNKGQASVGGQTEFDLVIETNKDQERKHISMVRYKTANVLAEVRLDNDAYHNAIQAAAQQLVTLHRGYTWEYLGSSTNYSNWLAVEVTDLMASVHSFSGEVSIRRR